MSAAGDHEAARLRRCRETFDYAVAHRVSMEAARTAIAHRRWAEMDARLAARRCGTLAEPAEAGRYWWQAD